MEELKSEYIVVLKLKELGMYPMGVPDEIVESYIAVHQAIQEQEVCGKCANVVRQDATWYECWKSNGDLHQKGWYCPLFTPKKDNRCKIPPQAGINCKRMSYLI